MAIPILMPALSPTMTEGSIAKWCKNVGDEVKPGDIIAEVETDKATMEIESVDEGVLEKILFNDGTEGIGVNSLIAILKSKNDTEQDIKDILDSHDSANNTMEIVINEVNDKEEVSEIVKKAPELNINPLNDAKVKEVIDNPVVSNELTSNNNLGIKITASPLAKRIALQNNIDLKNIIGSGPRGRIVKADLDNYFNK
ncbi:MAG: pyruvate dehydrogenase complex dihydrolipoamide acetyltransferase, partial [Pelagibacterales bacterium]|nr:pyruvate dehydrogenase complex dihydrolipoamide acetyltransferase [Pelagibacterales bacterium]